MVFTYKTNCVIEIIFTKCLRQKHKIIKIESKSDKQFNMVTSNCQIAVGFFFLINPEISIIHGLTAVHSFIDVFLTINN